MDTPITDQDSSVTPNISSEVNRNVVSVSTSTTCHNHHLDNAAALTTRLSNGITGAENSQEWNSRLAVALSSHRHPQNGIFRPHRFPNEEARLRYSESVARIARVQKLQIIEDSLAIEEYFKNCERILANQTLSYEQMAELMEQKLDWMRCEQRLLQIDVQIKFSLTLAQADVDKCLYLLDELGATTIVPLMLKKHPNVVETIKKLRKYVGNVEHWKLSAEEKVVFEMKASLIRMKAVQIYDKIKDLFCMTDSLSFWDAFMKMVDEFRAATKHLHWLEIRNMTEDPIIGSGTGSLRQDGVNAVMPGAPISNGNSAPGGFSESEVANENVPPAN